MGFRTPLLWLLLPLNLLIWSPLFLAAFPTIGLGHDSQLFTPGIHALLRSGNMPWDLTTRLLEARVDIFSYPYFSIIYPFYWTLGISGDFSYAQHLLLDLAAVIFHLVLASLTFGALLGRLGCRPSIAAFGGIAYAYSLHLKLWSGWLWAVSAYAWIPVCLIGIWEIVVARRQLQGMALLGLGFGMIALATGVGLVYGVVLSAALMMALWVKQSVSPGRALRDLGSIVMGGLLGAMIGAAHLLPVLYRMGDYIRWYSGGAIVGQFKPPYEGTLTPALAFPWDLQQLILPLTPEPGQNVGHLYVGAAVALLALALPFARATPWRRFSWVLWAFSLYFLLDAAGAATFVHSITYQIPLLGSIRYPLASVTIPVILLTLMACLALEYQLAKTDGGHHKTSPLMLVLYVSVLLTGVLMVYRSPDLIPGMAGVRREWLYALPVLVSLVALIATLAGSTWKWLRVLPVVLVFSYLPQYSVLLHPKVPDAKDLYLQCDSFTELESALRQWSGEVPEQSRLQVYFPKGTVQGCLADKKLSDALTQSLALMAGWDVVQSYISPRPLLEFKQFGQYANERALGQRSKLLQAGITHVLTVSGQDVPFNDGTLYREQARVGQFVLLEVRDAALGGDIAGCLTANGSRYKLVSDLGKRRVALPPELIELEGDKLHCIGTTAPLSTAINRRFSGAAVHYEFETPQPMLFVSDRVIRDDWQVSVNGRKVTAYRVDEYRLAVPVGQGRQEILLEHRPWDFYVGLVVTFAGALILLYLLLKGRKLRLLVDGSLSG